MLTSSWPRRLAAALWARVRGRPRFPRHADVPVTKKLVGVATRFHVPPEFEIYIDPTDPLIGRSIAEHHTYEAHVAIAIQGLLAPGDVFVDVGANLGFHTIVAARAVGPAGHVYAVEASPANCTLLRASLRHNGLDNVTLLPCAAGAAPGWARFCTRPGAGNGVLINRRPPRWLELLAGYGEYHKVRTLPLDDLIPRNRPVRAVKIDIEGAEPLALKGMRRLLDAHRPVLLFEFHPTLLRDIGGAEPVRLLDAVRSHGYRLHQVQSSGAFTDSEMSNDAIMAAACPPDIEHFLIDLAALPAPAPPSA
ncbi:MAG TPA: FkbM family methyltransferase [Gemmataceae bacterium]